MINRKRGEVLWRYAGRDYRLCLTLGALAELEHYFETAGLTALSERLSQGSFSAHDIVALLDAGLRGAGETITRDEILSFPVVDLLPSALQAVCEMVESAFGSDGEQTVREEGERSPFLGRR